MTEGLRVSTQPRGQIEETTIGDRILVIVSIVERKNLPLEATGAGGVVPACSLRVKDGLRQREPLRLR